MQTSTVTTLVLPPKGLSAESPSVTPLLSPSALRSVAVDKQDFRDAMARLGSAVNITHTTKNIQFPLKRHRHGLFSRLPRKVSYFLPALANVVGIKAKPCLASTAKADVQVIRDPRACTIFKGDGNIWVALRTGVRQE